MGLHTDAILYYGSAIKNKAGELTFKVVMLIQVYFRHAEVWHSKPEYKCINVNIRVPSPNRNLFIIVARKAGYHAMATVLLG